MRRHLSGEHGADLAHPLLDERMPDPVDQRLAARTLDRLGHRPRGPHVVDHLPAGLPREHRLGEQRRREVARHELARVVDEEASIGVAVVGDPECRLLLGRALHDELAVLREQRVRLVVRERPVGLEVATHDLHLGQALQHRREHHARHPVCRVDDDPERSDRLGVDEAEDPLDEVVPDVDRRDGPARGRIAPLAAHRPVADLDEPGLAPDRKRPAPHDLHPRVAGGVVRGRDHDPTVEAEVSGREVHHLGPDHPEVGHLDARVGHAVDHSFGHRRRREAHVPPDRDPAWLELLRERPPDRVGALLVELRRVEGANVICLERRGIEHLGDASDGGWKAEVRGQGGDEGASGCPTPQRCLWSGPELGRCRTPPWTSRPVLRRERCRTRSRAGCSRGVRGRVRHHRDGKLESRGASRCPDTITRQG